MHKKFDTFFLLLKKMLSDKKGGEKYSTLFLCCLSKMFGNGSPKCCFFIFYSLVIFERKVDRGRRRGEQGREKGEEGWRREGGKKRAERRWGEGRETRVAWRRTKWGVGEDIGE